MKMMLQQRMLSNVEADRLFCLLNAPNRKAVEKHHKKYGVKCEYIMEIKKLLSK